jgi:hypothetical protein
LWAVQPNGHRNPYEALESERSGLKAALDITIYVRGNVPSNFFLQLCGPAAAAVSRKFLHDHTNALHFRSFFLIYIIRLFTIKTGKFQVGGNNSVCAGTFQLLSRRAPAQLRGNMDDG